MLERSAPRAAVFESDAKSGGGSPGLKGRAGWLLALLCVAAVGLLLRCNSALDRPLEHDEISSANAYTSVGYIANVSELDKEHAGDAGRLARGLVRPLLGWNPNDHMIQEWAISLCSFLFAGSEASVRTAALAASVGTALLLMVWARRRGAAAPIILFCGLAAAAHPYLIYYGQTARGYSFTTLLLLLHILLLDEAAAGKRGLLRLALAILTGFALFLNLVSLLFLWLVPLYASMLWREARDGGRRLGLAAALRGEAFCWWFFQAAAVGGLILFFGLEHLPMFLRSQAEYGFKLASATAALQRMAGVIAYLFPGQWLLLLAAGVAGWFCMLKRRDWLAGPLAASVILSTLYAVVTRTVPYDRTFGIWIVFAIIGAASLWQKFANTAPALPVAAAAAGLFLGSALIWPHSMLPGPDYGATCAEISRQIQARSEPVGQTLVIAPFNSSEECLLHLPADTRFHVLPANPPKSLSIYLPCKADAGNPTGFRCTYYDRINAEMVYFELPQSWRARKTWGEDDRAIIRLNATVTSGIESITPSVPQIVVWRARNSYFDLDKYVTEKLLRNRKLPAFRFVPGYDYPTPTLIFFTNGDAGPLKVALTDLQAAADGSALVLTPGASQPGS